MTKLISLDAAIAAVTQADKDCRGAHGARDNIRSIPTIDPAAIRDAALIEAARIIVTHEMGTPMHSPPQLLTEAHDRILALIGKANSMIGEKK